MENQKVRAVVGLYKDNTKDTIRTHTDSKPSKGCGIWFVFINYSYKTIDYSNPGGRSQISVFMKRLMPG